jgi:hypothetical protein
MKSPPTSTTSFILLGTKRTISYIDDPILWVVGVGTADVQTRAITHQLDDANVVPTVVKLKEEKQGKKSLVNKFHARRLQTKV